ncbi:succinyl- ligase alpha-chain protein [Apiospora arundinis]
MLSCLAPRRTRPQLRLPRLTAAAAERRSSFGTTAVNRISSKKYDATLKNLKIGKHTRVIFQGFTGRQASANAKESIAWGTNIVGGVKPGYEGEHLGLPVFPSVSKARVQHSRSHPVKGCLPLTGRATAVEVIKPDATGIYVAAHHAKAAIVEAIEAEVPLIVAVAEHIPLHDILEIHSILETQSASRLVGANSPGIISAVGKCRIGFQPLPCFEPGKVGIVAKSGTLSYETAASTLRAGLGQSLCIGVGGDVLSGTGLVDGLKILVEDENTEAIAICGEIGGYAELEAAEWIKQYRAKTRNPKPIAAVIAGVNVAQDRVMGHAGAFRLIDEPSAQEKIKALVNAGVDVVNHPSRFGPALKSSLLSLPQSKMSRCSIAPTAAAAAASATSGPSQRRTLHTLTTNKRPHPPYKCSSGDRRSLPRITIPNNTRTLHLQHGAALNVLQQCGFDIHKTPDDVPISAQRLIAVSINRDTGKPCIIAGSPNSIGAFENHEKLDLVFGSGKDWDFDDCHTNISKTLNLDIDRYLDIDPLNRLMRQLVDLFISKEAYQIVTFITTATTPECSAETRTTIQVTDAHLCFDDAAFRSGNRQADIHALHALDHHKDPAEASAEPHGIVYIKLGRAGGSPGDSSNDYHHYDPSHNIGTLVNGAGLAMNTVDALVDAGGKAANFLDTGGKATSETVKRSFEVILQDERVKCIFVNIFGGLTLGDMIARGIVLAFQDLEKQLATIPVVVRIRGTNEAEGQKIIADSGLPGLYPFDDFDEAAAKAVELAAAAATAGRGDD